MRLPDPQLEKFVVSLQTRGQGEILVRIRDATGKYHGAIKAALDDSSRWQILQEVVECQQPGAKTLALRITGTIDVDDIRVLPLREETMPDAARH